ncbi:AMMECR1 domain-containing protein [Gloeopeniophorella convolvens]|nr:AMMECR1 domain-containing protein [Gloeopeniophorella convolvens]
MALVPPDPAAPALTKSRADDVDDDDGGDTCTPEHCFAAFDALYCALARAPPLEPRIPAAKHPLFVTFNTRRRSAPPRLRGCLGTFDAQPLPAALREYALLSAFRDHRFRRIAPRELPALECGVSLLTDFEDAASYLDWTPGTHGIQVSFAPPPARDAPPSDAPSPLASADALPLAPPARRPPAPARRTLSATYLPEVAPEQGWDRVEAVDSALRKAGWAGPIDEDLRRAARVRRYQSRRCVVGWDEFVAWRAARGAPVDFAALEG